MNPLLRLQHLLLLPTAAALTLPATDLKPIAFGSPEVLKLDWNTRCIRSADFNGDQLPDLALLNLDRARIELLIQSPDGPKDAEPERRSNSERWNPVLEVSRFDKQNLVVGQPMYALAVGDWNGDGKPDLAYTTEDGKLVLRFQGSSLTDWSERQTFDLDSTSISSESLLTHDINGDGRLDLILITQTQLLIFQQPAEGPWPAPTSYLLSDKDADMLQLADLNQDGKPDIILTTANSKSLLVRLQQKDGSYGQEWVLSIPQPGSWVQTLRHRDETALAWIQENTSVVQLARITETAQPAADSKAAIRYGLPASDARTGAAVFADINHDQLPDVILAEPKAARVWLFRGRKDGSFAVGQEFPAFSGIEHLAVQDLDGDGKPELIMLSPTERSIGVAKWENNRLQYPDTVYQGEKNLSAMTAGLYAGNTSVLSIEEKTPQPELIRIHWNSKDKTWQTHKETLSAVTGKINAIRLADADQDGQPDLLLFSALSPMQILLHRKDGPMIKATGLPDSLTAKQPASALSLGDLDGDGKAELILSKDQIARAFVCDSDGKARTIEQFNAPNPAAKIATTLITGSGDQLSVRMIDPKDGKIYDLRRENDNVFRNQRTLSISNAGSEELHFYGPAEKEHLLLLSKDRFEITPLNGKRLQLDVFATFDSELKDTSPSDLITANFSGGETDDIVLLDNTKTRVFEFFSTNTADAKDWQSRLYFRIFQQDPHFRGKTGYDSEPHDFAVIDLNQDGIPDLCLLVHNRLLIYLAQ